MQKPFFNKLRNSKNNIKASKLSSPNPIYPCSKNSWFTICVYIISQMTAWKVGVPNLFEHTQSVGLLGKERQNSDFHPLLKQIL